MDLTGKQLADKYQIQGELGRGGMGIVYRAYDSRLRRQVAIKALAPHLAGDPLFVERFQREAIAAGNLHHSNIVTIYDVGTEPGAGDHGQDVHYIVMQYVKGESLHQWLRQQRRPMPLADTTAIVRQIGDALQYAHDRGMVHRDVKPANVMLDDDGHITLMDFGLVRAGEMSQLTQSGSVLGTPAYMAPEQITGAVVDRRTDVYAFGVMIYELLVGEAPFVRTTPMAVAHAHVYDPPPPLREKRPDLSTEVELVVRKALAKEPTARFADASSLTRAFAAATTGEQERLTMPAGAPINAGQTQRPSAPEPAQPGKGRPGPALWVVAILGVLALGAAAVLALRANGNASRTVNAPIIEPAASDTPTLRPEATSTTAAPAVAATATRPPAATSTSVAPTSTPVSRPPTATPDQSPVLQAVGVDAVNLRGGPGTEYPRVGQLRPGDALDIVGRTADSGWWQVCCIEGEPAWIASNLVQASGSVEGVPVVAAIPAPPTSTALPTAASTTAPPLPTSTPTACLVPPGPSFAQHWNRQELGCPTTSETGVTSAYEAFERGWMLWRKDTDGIYAVFDDGSYQAFFYPSDEPPQFSCPEAQYLDRPQRGFGMAWCANPDVRNRIGNALDYEIGDSRPIQDFDRGFMLFVPERGHVYALYSDGTWKQRD